MSATSASVIHRRDTSGSGLRLISGHRRPHPLAGRVRLPPRMPGQHGVHPAVDQPGEQVAQRPEHGQQQHHLHPVRLAGDPRFDRVDDVEHGLPHACRVRSESPRPGTTVSVMLAVYADAPHADDPLAGVVVGERPEPVVPDGWSRVRVRAASLNRHDLWTLRGVGITPDRFPMILGCDGAGVTDDGRNVVLYPVIGQPGWAGDETADPGRTLLTEKYQGTFAEYVAVPSRNLLPLPASLTYETAAVLGTTYLTAYRMVATRSGLPGGSTILVQGATGGVSTALIQLGRALGMRVWATSRSEAGRARAAGLGARTTCSTRAPGCRNGWTACSSPSASRPGRTRCGPCGPAA